MTHAMSHIIRFFKDNLVVLLHCKAGKHRSGFEGAMTLALMRDLTWDQAKNVLFETRGFYSHRDKQIITELGQNLKAQDFLREFHRTNDWGDVRAAFRGDLAPKVFCKARGFSFSHMLSGVPARRLSLHTGVRDAGTAGTLVRPKWENPRGIDR